MDEDEDELVARVLKDWPEGDIPPPGAAQVLEMHRWRATLTTMLDLDPEAALEMYHADGARRDRKSALLVLLYEHWDGKALHDMTDGDWIKLDEILAGDTVSFVLGRSEPPSSPA